MNWYLAKIIFQIQTGSRTPSQFDEQMRLIHATSMHEAFQKARAIGIRSEEKGNTGEPVSVTRWEFVDVAHLEPVDEFYDGMELCSRVHETEESAAYIHYVKSRAKFIEESFGVQTPQPVSIAC